ncbi:MAG: glycoside hydrolase family 27 protein [Clostridia bacterium]|nr:glycoside hydrolase family 27 protein [Clostridia bacterium]
MIINKPPMGWNSWNTFAWSINDQLIRETADVMVSSGLRDAGYEYVVIDDCYALRDRGPDGRIVPDPDKFPHGMRSLADYIHSKGLKFGMYSCAGIMTCAQYPSSFDKEFLDAQTFADWGVDYLKYDFCNFPKTADPRMAYARMSMALKATGRDIVFSACNWGEFEVEKWIRSTSAHLYRSTGDIGERFSAVINICQSQDKKIRYSAPGCYNDMDMLIVGMDGIGNVGHPGLCGDTEYKTHFALWCLNGQPLMMGSDLRRLRPEMLALLTNKDLLRIDQDEECRPPIVTGPPWCNRPCYFKHLSDRQFVLAFFNLEDEEGSSDFRPWDIGFPTTAGFGMSLREVFTGEVKGPINDYISVDLAPHDCSVFIGEWVAM